VAHEQAEVIEAHWIPFDQALQWGIDGTIRDGKTAIGLIRAANLPAVRAALSRG